MHVCPECGEAYGGAGFCPRDGMELKDAKGDTLLGQNIGSYKVSRLLGEGGMGRVYKGVHPSIGSRVAIKVLSADCSQNRELIDRFFAEARAVNVIRHENIVNVLDLATLPDGRPYIVMEHLDGAPLSSIIASRGPLPLGGFARVMGETLDALAAAHAKGIVHRDLKPDNIFVSPNGHATVLDFGIAKLMPTLGQEQAGPTRAGSILGTPQYMSPEQALAQAVDSRTDIYAVGVILFEGATGRPPFSAPSLFDLLRQHIETPPPPPRSLRPDMPPALEAVILRALEKDPARRFQSVVELSQALNQATQALPPDAWAPIGTATASRAAVGPPSGSGWPLAPSPVPGAPGGMMHATPQPMHGAPTPHPLTPQPGMTPAPGVASWPSATSPGAHQAQPGLSRSIPPKKGKAGLVVGIVVGLAVIGGGVAVIATRGGGGNDPRTRAAAVVNNGIDPEREGPDGPANLDLSKELKQLEEVGRALEKLDIGELGEDGSGRGGATDKGGEAANAPFNPKRFDVTGFIDQAEALAREEYEDAVLVRIDAEGVFPDGIADLTLDSDFSVLYRFQSPSRSKPQKEEIVGVKSSKQDCVYYVNVEEDGINAYPLKGWDCDYVMIGRPKCSAKQVWEKALKLGAPSGKAVADMGYWDDGDGKGRWYVSVGDKFSKFVSDSCK